MLGGLLLSYATSLLGKDGESVEIDMGRTDFVLLDRRILHRKTGDMWDMVYRLPSQRRDDLEGSNTALLVSHRK